MSQTPQPTPTGGSGADATPGVQAGGATTGAPASAPRRPGTGTRVAGGVLALAVLGGGAALAHSMGLGPSGKDLTPADLLPATTTLAVAQVDLDPSLQQQVDMYRFAQKVPSLKSLASGGTGGDVKAALWQRASAKHPCPGIDYARDLEPWLGQRAAVALLPGKEQVIVVQASDQAAARAAVPKLQKCSATLGDPELASLHGIAFRDGYLVLAPSQAQADDVLAAGSSDPLSAADDYVEDTRRVGTQGVASFWAGKQGLVALQQQARKAGHAAPTPDLATMPLRSMAGTIRFSDGNPDLRVVARATRELPTSTTFSNLERLPSDVALAYGVSDGSTLVQQYWPQVQWLLDRTGLSERAQRLDLGLPGDLRTLLAKDLRVSVASPSGTRQGPVAVASTGDVDAVRQLVGRLTVGGVAEHEREGALVMGTDEDWTSHVADTHAEMLGANAVFTSAFPTTEQQQVGLFANLERLQPLLDARATAAQRRDLDALRAASLGLHVEDSDYVVLAGRLTTR